MTPPLLNDDHPATGGWHWKQTHWDNFRLTGPAGEVHDFRTYADLCWWCGTHGINATQV